MMPSRPVAQHSFFKDLKEASCSYKSVPLKKNGKSNLLKRVQKTYEKFKKKPLAPVFKTRIDGPSSVWNVFRRLQMAATYADSCTKDCMVFACEDKVSCNGQRMFLVACPEQVWQNHSIRQLEERCSYEVIRENFPCKLYFDLEYYTAFNNNKNGNEMTKIFIKCVIASMYHQHGLIVKDSDFLWLDASNDSKFSCHLILQMKGVAFQNNIHAGTFVSILSATLRKKVESNESSDGLWPSSAEIKTLFVKFKKETEVLFCDEGVYSRNRNFRMYLSTKYGKKCPLILSPHNKYWPVDNHSYNEEAIFYDSLITYFRNHDIYKLLCYEQSQTEVSIHSQRIKNKTGVSGSASSPFPELDNFILNVVTDGLVSGFIRKWTHYSKEQKIIYDIGNYRYCGNIGRHHKSNNIRIIVDMKAKCYYQTCLDPECRHEGYQSKSTAIPEDIISINIPDDFFDECCFSELQPKGVEPEENNNDASLFSEEMYSIHRNENLKDNKAEQYCSQETGLQKMTTDNFFNNTVDKFCEDWKSSFGDFSELSGLNNKTAFTRVESQSIRDVNSNDCINDNLDQESWGAFFTENFTCTEKKVSQKTCENLNEDFSFLNDEQPWSSDSIMEDSIISIEEEMLMVEAAEAVEVAMDENNFSEETVF